MRERVKKASLDMLHVVDMHGASEVRVKLEMKVNHVLEPKRHKLFASLVVELDDFRSDLTQTHVRVKIRAEEVFCFDDEHRLSNLVVVCTHTWLFFRHEYDGRSDRVARVRKNETRATSQHLAQEHVSEFI